LRQDLPLRALDRVRDLRIAIQPCFKRLLREEFLIAISA
jgi:hypothetical protein